MPPPARIGDCRPVRVFDRGAETRLTLLREMSESVKHQLHELPANTSIDPAAPACTMAALALTVPVGGFKEAAARGDPVGHAAK